ncbi:MAG TPA: alpha/beta hydrolase [Devosia sp.]
MSSITVRNLAENRSLYASAEGDSRLDADIGFLLRQLDKLEPKRLETCTVPEARAQPTLMQALNRILRDPNDDQGVNMELRLIPGAAGEIRARIYTPRMAEAERSMPLVLYIHGGGWVIGDLDSYDAAPRALARRLGAVVVSTHYRQAPEFTFPAAHDDALAAWRWTLDNAETLGADRNLRAIVGDGAGGNLAVNVALDAKAEGLDTPQHLALITPMTGTDFGLSSYAENRETLPLNSATVEWFYSKYARDAVDLANPKLNLIDRPDLGGLPPTTIILAEHDPLRTEGDHFAQALRRSGVWVDCTLYDGVTHQFFNLAQAVNKGMFAQGQVVRNINGSFGRG